jgi:hypothetical protein
MYAKINENDYTINEARLIEAWTLDNSGNDILKQAPAHFTGPKWELNLEKGDGKFLFNKGGGTSSYMKQSDIDITTSSPDSFSDNSRKTNYLKKVFRLLAIRKKPFRILSSDDRTFLKNHGWDAKYYNDFMDSGKTANEKIVKETKRKALTIYYLKRYLLLHRWKEDALKGPFNYQSMWQNKKKGDDFKKSWPTKISGSSSIKKQNQLKNDKYYYYSVSLDERIHEVSTNPFEWPTPYANSLFKEKKGGAIKKISGLKDKLAGCPNRVNDTCKLYKDVSYRSEFHTIVKNEYNNFWLKIKYNGNKKPRTTAEAAAEAAASATKEKTLAKADVLIKIAYLCRPIGSSKKEDWKLITIDKADSKKIVIQYKSKEHDVNTKYIKFEFEENLELLIVALVGVGDTHNSKVKLNTNEGKKILNDSTFKINIDGKGEKKMTILKDHNDKVAIKSLVDQELNMYDGDAINNKIFDNNVYVFSYETKGRRNGDPGWKSIEFVLSGKRKEVKLSNNQVIKPSDMENKGDIKWPEAFHKIKWNGNTNYYGFNIISMSTSAVIMTVIGSIICAYILIFEVIPRLQDLKNKKSGNNNY